MGCKIQRMTILKLEIIIFNIVILLLPWRWPRVWPKHVEGQCNYNLISIFVRAFRSYYCYRQTAGEVMHDGGTVTERSLWVFPCLTQGDCGKTQKPGPQKVRNLSAVYERQLSIPSKTFVNTETGTTGRKTQLNKNIFCFLRSESNVVVLFSIVI